MSFTVSLSNPSAPAQLAFPATTTVTVVDVDGGVAFSTATNSVGEGAGSILVSVVRNGAVNLPATVSYATDTNGTAAAGVRYVPTSGILNFAAGQSTASFAVTILEDNLLDGNQTVELVLSNSSTGMQLLSPSVMIFTIIDDDSGLAFSGPNYSVSKGGVSASITVVRTGASNSTVSW